ncbi:MAG TPA: RNA polymerase factor sigma-54 [Paludibacteraceae bacterium]|nr:RNA polymerase factor sigma-54 [Paludibacteraceae bacterium]HQB68795.1 RNA polymerase factor sigma-54 [Paludibacteraceae bacterium]HRS67421.1 RNA polymerase factor sigma-54 [Paludibacteraceae bacterium]
MLKQQLSIKQQQKLSPLQIQVIKMLEYPTVELEERIREEMEANPALDEGREESVSEHDDFDLSGEEDYTNDDFDLTEYAADDDIPDYKLRTNNHSADDKEVSIPLSSHTTFHEYLSSQLELGEADTKIRHLAQYLIGNIDDDGYLRREIEAMVDDLAFQFGLSITDADMEKALALVQNLDPAGVGARDLRECLLIQLRHKPNSSAVVLAERVIDRFFDQFSKKQYDAIARRLGLSEDEMKDVVAEIMKLNPKPGNAFSTPAEILLQQVTPDFIVENNNGRLSVSLNNSNIPELRVSKTYTDMVSDFVGNKENQNREMRDAILFAKQKIDAARWFIDAIKQRNVTLLKTMNAIVEEQYDFFLEGDDTKLRPMKLKDIADKVGFDVSTISRVSNSKYVQTDFGVFPLKYFFSETMQTVSGEEVSNKEIKQIIVDIVAEEDKSNPIVDDVLTEMLREKGYIIARRTVAKYREQLNIPVARLRKE